MKNNERQYMKNITELNLSGYKFELNYAETLDEGIAEFPHSHFSYEIYYVLEGSIHIEIAGHLESIGTHQACFLSKGIKHHVRYDPDVAKQYFAVIFDIIPSRNDPMNGPSGPLEYRDLEDAMYLFNSCGYYISQPFSDAGIPEALNREMTERKLGWNTQSVLLCYQFFLLALRQIHPEQAMDKQFSGHENLTMSVSKYIHKHYPEDISLESVSNALNVSPRHINRAYKNAYDITFMKNTNLLRIAYAKYYLCNTTQSIEEIAEQVGFTSVRTLYKLFQQYEGISISQYRILHRQKLNQAP